MSNRTWDDKHELSTCLEHEDDAATPARVKRGDALGAIVANLFVLAVVNSYAWWGPWTAGVITASFVDVVWAANLTCVVTIAGNALLLFFPARALARAVELLNNAASIVSTAVVLAVFPFAFVRIGLPWVDLVVWIVLAVAVFGLAIALCVRLVRGLLA